jgi:acetyl esterase/lipase
MIKYLSPPLGERGARMMNKICGLLKGRHKTGLRYEQIQIPREDGTLLRLCVYSPQTLEQDKPGLLWIHGGGLSAGAPEQDEEAYVKRFIEWGACVVAAPDYAKSVEKPYPAAIDDCFSALQWLKANGSKYGMRPDQIFVGGASAGGGLAAALSLAARDSGKAAVAFQMPLYPMLDDRPTSSNTNNNAPLWSSKANDLAWRLYLGELYGKSGVPSHAAPARASDYSGLPPTFTFVGDVEVFYSETLAYAENLRKAGVPVQLRVFGGCFHAFDMVCPKTSVGKEAAKLIESAFRHAVSNCFAAQPD